MNECPSHGASELAAVANAVRASFAFDLAPQGYVGVEGLTSTCRVPSAAGAIEIGPPGDGFRGYVAAGRPTSHHGPAPAVSGETTTFDFEDDLTEIPPGPFEGLPVLVVGLSACNTHHFVLALDGDRWHVVTHLRGSC